jgi:hypothetical protein
MWNAQSHQIWQKSRPVAFNLASDSRCGVDDLDPRVDRLVRDLFVLRPVWDQTPTKHVEFVVSCLGVFPDRQNVLTRRDVVGDREIELRRDCDMVLLRYFLFGCRSSVASAHGSRLQKTVCAINRLVHGHESRQDFSS